MSSECKGCTCYEVDFCVVGIIPHLEGTDGCPCRTCLVKSMCSDDTCLAYVKYRILSRDKRSFRQVLKDLKNEEFSYYR